jgi:hypothetical protein
MEILTDQPVQTPWNDPELIQRLVANFIQQHHPCLTSVRDYIPQAQHPDQLWQQEEENYPTYWIFFKIILADQPEDHDPLAEREYIEKVLEEMLLSDHPAHLTLSLSLSEALEIEFLVFYRLYVCLNQDDPNLTPSITDIRIDLDPA